MKSVTNDFLAAQNRRHLKYSFEINMYRRYWDTGTETYKWEESATDIKPYVLKKSNISWQLDTEGLNVWRVSNIQLELKNTQNEWDEVSPKSFFGSSYTRYKTKIEIKVGYILADRTIENVYNFTGLILGDPANNFLKQTIVMNLSGKEQLLTLASAEDVSIVVTDETLGTGSLNKKFYIQNVFTIEVSAIYVDTVIVDTSDYTITGLFNKTQGAIITFDTAPVAGTIITADSKHDNSQIIEAGQIGTGSLIARFETAYKGVGFIDVVYLDGVALTPEIDYITENLNNKNKYARIIFTLGIGVGQIVTCDYRRWYADIPIETLVGYLLDNAGFPSGDRTIGAIDVGALIKYKVWSNKQDFESMDLLSRNIDTSTFGKAVVMQENLSSDIAEALAVTLAGVYPDQTIVAANANPSFDNQYDGNELPDAATPVWDIYFLTGNPTREAVGGILHLECVITSPSVYDVIRYRKSSFDAYRSKARIKLSCSVDPPVISPTFDVCVGGSKLTYNGGLNWRWTVDTIFFDLSIAGGRAWDDYHTFEIRRDTAGEWTYCFFDGVYKGRVNSTYSNPQIGIIGGIITGRIYNYWLDYSYDDAIVCIGKIVSKGIDLRVAPSAISSLGTTYLKWTDPSDGSFIEYQAQTSDSSDFTTGNDSWRDISLVGAIGTIHASTILKRYLRWRATIVPNAGTSPTITRVALPGHLMDKVDCGTNLDIYVSFIAIIQNNNGLIKILSATSDDDSAWDAEQEIIAGVISSTKRRYIRFRTIIYLTAESTSPDVFKEQFSYKITSINVAMADFTEMTVQEAMEEIARLLDYEIGVGSDGDYFFRARNINAEVDLELSDQTNIISVDNDSMGWSRIFNYIKIIIGRFSTIISPITEEESLPHSITTYGLRPLIIESNVIQIDDDLDLSGSLADIYYARYKLQKRELRLLCKMLPQLELSDTVRVSYGNTAGAWILGDVTKILGVITTIFTSKYAKSNYYISPVVTNVVGLELDINNFKLYVSVREI